MNKKIIAIIIVSLLLVALGVKTCFEKILGHQHNLYYENIKDGKFIRIDKVGYPRPKFSYNDKYIYYVKKDKIIEKIFSYNIEKKYIKIAFNINVKTGIKYPSYYDNDMQVIFLTYDENSNHIIYNYNKRNDKLTELFRTKQNIRDTVVASNGKKLLYLKENNNKVFDLCLFDTNSKQERIIFKSESLLFEPDNPIWSRDSKKIAFRKRTAAIVIMNSNGKILDEVSIGSSISYISFFKNNKFLLINAMSPEQDEATYNLYLVSLINKTYDLASGNRSFFETMHETTQDGNFITYIK